MSIHSCNEICYDGFHWQLKLLERQMDYRDPGHEPDKQELLRLAIEHRDEWQEFIDYLSQ